MMNSDSITRINDGDIMQTLSTAAATDKARILAILDKARELKGLSDSDIVSLMYLNDPMLEEALFETARYAKETIYGKRMVIFAPLYVSNYCANECAYCSFRCSNNETTRKKLSTAEIAAETRALINQGQKRILLVAGESPAEADLDYILNAIDTVYATRSGNGEIRRINVNIAPLKEDEFHRLKEAKIGTYQIFQETYHRATYAEVHRKGHKRNFDWRLSAIERAMRAGIDDVGIGVLYGLYDWKFETLAMMRHIHALEDQFGVGPHTISVPRLEPAEGCTFFENSKHLVTDHDFRKLIAILRLAVPYTGIILSTRENPSMRHEAFTLGVSQISAGSRTNPGGYAEDELSGAQFQLGDHRPLLEVVKELLGLGYIPSFCTGCYRLGRVGADFMDLARPGEIKNHCDPNALSTLTEYALDYGDEELRRTADAVVEATIGQMDGKSRERSRRLVDRVRSGDRDQFC